jgi:hypothetical protein
VECSFLGETALNRSIVFSFHVDLWIKSPVFSHFLVGIVGQEDSSDLNNRTMLICCYQCCTPMLSTKATIKATQLMGLHPLMPFSYSSYSKKTGVPSLPMRQPVTATFKISTSRFLSFLVDPSLGRLPRSAWD